MSRPRRLVLADCGVLGRGGPGGCATRGQTHIRLPLHQRSHKLTSGRVPLPVRTNRRSPRLASGALLLGHQSSHPQGGRLTAAPGGGCRAKWGVRSSV